MFKKTKVFAVAAVMAFAAFAAGCGGEESATMNLSNEKASHFEFSNANVDDFVQGGFIKVEEGEQIEIESDLNEDGKVQIALIMVPDEESKDEIPDRDQASYEIMISGVATEGSTVEPGEYDIRATVLGKATGTVDLSVIPVAGAETADEAGAAEAGGETAAETGGEAEGGHTNWTQVKTAEEAAKGAGLDSLADLGGTQTSLGVLGEQGEIKYRYMDGIAQIFCPVAAVEMSVVKGRVPSGDNGDVSMDGTAYAHEWTQDVDGLEVKCFGNREGEATKTIWTAGDYNYAVMAYGAGGDDDFGLSAEDVAVMVNAVK